MPAAQTDLILQQGKTFNEQWIYYEENGATPIDLTGKTARLQVRASYDSLTALVNLTTENGGIALGGIAGTITFSLSATETAALDFVRGVWELELVTGAVVESPVGGTAYLEKEAVK
jgi:hypothetical protein